MERFSYFLFHLDWDHKKLVDSLREDKLRMSLTRRLLLILFSTEKQSRSIQFADKVLISARLRRGVRSYLISGFTSRSHVCSLMTFRSPAEVPRMVVTQIFALYGFSSSAQSESIVNSATRETFHQVDRQSLFASLQ